MLQLFTWQQFLIAALILTLIWYAGVILLIYRKELNDLLSGIGKRTSAEQPEPLRHAWDEDFENETPIADENLMGKPVLPEGVSRVSMSMFGFAPKTAKPEEQKETHEDDDKNTQLGLVPDVLEELKRIIEIMAKRDGNKSDFFSLLKSVKEKYLRIASSPNIGSINAYIREHVPFHLTGEELENLWD